MRQEAPDVMLNLGESSNRQTCLTIVSPLLANAATVTILNIPELAPIRNTET